MNYIPTLMLTRAASKFKKLFEPKIKVYYDEFTDQRSLATTKHTSQITQHLRVINLSTQDVSARCPSTDR